MSILINNPIGEFVEIYQNSTELQKLVIVDVIQDLLIQMNRETIRKTPEMVFIQPMLNELTEDITSASEECQAELVKLYTDSVYPLALGESIIVFGYQKDRIRFNSEIRNHFKGIGNHEEKEVWNLRKMIIQNLIIYGFIRKADLSGLPLAGLFQEYQDSLIIKDNSGNITGINKDLLFDRDSESYKQINGMYSEDELEKSMLDFFQIQFENFIFKRPKLESLLESITGESIEKNIRYDTNTCKLWYGSNFLEFKKGELPANILQIFFEDEDISFGLTYEELYKRIEEVHELPRSYYESGLRRYRNSVKGVNKRIRGVFPGISIFLESRKKALYRTI